MGSLPGNHPELDVRGYARAAVDAAIYAIQDRAAAHVTGDADVTRVRLLPLGATDPAQLEREFLLLLGDFQLRHAIAERTRVVRDVIVSAALAEARGRHG